MNPQEEEQSIAPFNKIKEFLIKLIKGIADIKNVIKIAELALALLFTALYGKRPLISW
jgi:hypothetical protein